jgi:hypothetical protein
MGPPAEMVFMESITSQPIRAGEFLTVPPHLQILDAGGNLLYLDSTSEIRIQIHDLNLKDSNGKMGPPSQISVRADRGIVQMSSLRVDAMIGPRYRLAFHLHRFDALSLLYEDEPSVIALTDEFYLELGEPRRIIPLLLANEAWAGGQPFDVQPVIALTDSANNPLDYDSYTNISAHVVTSLSDDTEEKRIVIDTSDANTTLIVSVQLNVENNTYGAGEQFDITVEFEYEVWVDLAENSTDPFILLNILTDSGSTNVSAFLNRNYTSDKTTALVFTYMVAPGDMREVLPLDYAAIAIQNDQYSRIVDGNDFDVNLTLPSFRKTVFVNTSKPYIIGFTTEKPDGEYGTGEHIYLNVEYNFPVRVLGSPYLSLNLNDSFELGIVRNASFHGMSNENHTVVFLYKVQSLDMANNVTLNNNSIQWTPTPRWHDHDSIRRQSTYPLTVVDLEIPGAALASFNTNRIVIDSTPPRLNGTYGLQTENPDGYYYPGDILEFTVQFDKEVAYQGILIELLLSVGGPKVVGQATILGLADDNKTMSFQYNVTEGVNTSMLDIYPTLDFAPALRVFGWPSSYIRRLATEPTEDVIYNTSWINSTVGNSLVPSHAIGLYGIKPIVTAVHAFTENITSPFSSNLVHVYRNDVVKVNVTFNAPVFPTCDDPVLVVQTLNTFRNAKYVSGGGSTVWTFEYLVELGDDSPTGVYYRHLPNALCPDSSCASATSCKILTSSATAIMEIDYIMPWRGRSKLHGWRITPDIIVHPTYPPGHEVNTSAVAATINHESETELGAGHVVVIQIYFSDDVFIGDANDPPKLFSSFLKNMTYNGGHGTKVFSFVAFIEEGDDVDIVDVMAVNFTDSAFICVEPCSMYNRLGEDINRTTTGLTVNATVSIDTSVPVVVDVWTDKNTSEFGSWYGVGESVLIYIEFSKPVALTTYGVRLRMDVSNGDKRYAMSDRDRSWGNVVVFEYIVALGDYSGDLMYLGRDAIERYGDHELSKIYRDSITFSTEADYVLPIPRSLSKNKQVIAIDSFLTPTVTNVASLNTNKRYAVGDTIEITVTFSHHVQVFGEPYLNLNGADRNMIATYVEVDDNAPTKFVLFSYTVSENDYAHDLDYVDIYSLQRGYRIDGYRGSFLLASTTPTTNATLDLPTPGLVGSLGFNNDIVIDGYPSYITALDFITPTDAVYSLGTVIQIVMNFSTPVEVVGHPTILLETGMHDRLAVYTSGSGTDALIFEYIPQPGDMTYRLDYVFDRSNLNSCAESFSLEGIDGTGAIYTLSENSYLPAHVYFNPQKGELLGSSSIMTVDGISYFFDLQIHYQGPDYEIRYLSTPLPGFHSTFTATQMLYVSGSSEFELRTALATKDDRIGWAVDTDGTVSVVGAPYSNKIVKDVQTVTTTLLPNTKLESVFEVQLMRVEMDHVPEVQSFYSTASVYADVGGFFTLDYENLGPTRPIPRNANPEMVEVIIMRDIPKLGKVSVTRESYIYCACTGAYTWNITFHDLTSGTINPLVFDGSGLTGDGASIVGPAIIQNSSAIGGTFTIINDDGVASPDVAFDADDNEVIAALAAIDIEAHEINIGPTNTAGSRTWTITFGAIGPYGGSHEIPTLKSDASKITGGDAVVWHTTAREGRHGPVNADGISGISGGFKLEWRTFVTEFIPFNANASVVEASLEELPVISNVTVVRIPSPDLVGFTWIISLDGTLKETPTGFEVDEHGPFEAFVAHNMLVGTNTTVKIGSKSNDDVRNYGQEVRGLYGYNAGSVHIYQRTFDDADHWHERMTIVGNDTDSYDQFGSSVSLSGNVLSVGAVGAETIGVPEIQSIYCEADSGYFVLSFRGWTTSAIPHNVSRTDLAEFIQGDLGEMGNIHSMHSFTIEDWGGGGLCSKNTARITVQAPVDGVGLSDSGADIEEFVVDMTTLQNNSVDTTVIISEEQKGTLKLHGTDTNGLQTGSAYVFRSELDCDDLKVLCTKKKWIQEAQFFPTDINGEEQFGFSISSTYRKIAVGAPGTLDSRGAVYLYMEEPNKEWRPMGKKLTASAWVPEANDEFGYDISLQDDTLAIGTPGRYNDTGAVFIFRQNSNVSFVATQEVRPPADLFNWNKGDRFGCSVAVDANMLVIGSCGYDDSTIHLGQTPNKVATNTGSVLIFRRLAGDYFYEQQLIPSNVKRFDSFGHDVAIDKNTVLVGAVEEMLEGYVARAPILLVKVSADYNEEPIDGQFRLQWVSTNETGEWKQRTTRLMDKDIRALDFRRVLESDLLTGPLLVTRSNMDIYDGGYAWTVTFLTRSHVPTSNFEHVKDDLLTGTNPKVECTVINPTPPIKRGKTHVFTRIDDVDNTDFEEQVFLSPYKYEPVDRCGWSVALSGDYAIVGCPNRDWWTPNNNAGAAYVYKMDFLNLMFEDLAPTVTEGDWLDFNVVLTERDSKLDDILYWVGTLDRNAFLKRQTLISDLYGLHENSHVVPYTTTAIDTADIAGTAVARNQYYGSDQEEHKWVDGMYDYRGISDYAANDIEKNFLNEFTGQRGEIKTTADTLLENLDETFTVLVHSPGFWPSILGRLSSLATIEDNWDGYVTINDTTFFQYDKVYAANGVKDCDSGTSMDLDGDSGVLVNGCPGSAVSGVSGAGLVFLYKQVLGHWALYASLKAPNATVDGNFGASVAVNTAYGRNLSTILVGEPGLYRVHVFTSSSNQSWVYDATLYANMSLVSQDNFAATGTLALDGDVAIVGAPGIETIFRYTRRFDEDTLQWTWSEPVIMRSVNYDIDNNLGVELPHHQGFGASIALSGRTIAVGSPFADYDNIASPNTEVDWLTEGTDIEQTSRGRVYLFDSHPSVQYIRLLSDLLLDSGTFKIALNYRGQLANSSAIHFNATSLEMKIALEELENIDLLEVSAEKGTIDVDGGTAGFYYTWTVTFLSEWQDPPLMYAYWNATECEECEPMSNLYTHSNVSQITVSRVNDFKTWERSHEVSAGDKRRGDRFGMKVALDDDVLAVGAVNSAAVTTTTWDFEVGMLQGWITTGDAFDFQPTWGDNSYYHAEYRAGDFYRGFDTPRATRTNPRGRYHIGTFEKRPGHRSDYRAADPEYPQGNTQGDEPVGTMESQVFQIGATGTKISFLIGGGCNPDLEYVELLVDGLSISRHTGKCKESMQREYFDVALFQQRMAQIKIVDLGKGPWGHINVDDFQFDWDTKGGRVNDTNSQMSSDLFGGLVETSRSGAVHVFQRHGTKASVMVGVLNARRRLYDICSTCDPDKSDPVDPFSPGHHHYYDDPTAAPSTDPTDFPSSVDDGTIPTSIPSREKDMIPNNYCTGDKSLCSWSEVVKLTASDKRQSDRFGTSLAVNAKAGIVVVGAPYTGLTGFYKETPSVYPYLEGLDISDPLGREVLDISDASGSHFPIFSQNESFLQHAYTQTSQPSGTHAVMNARQNADIYPDARGYRESGAVYVYRKSHEYIDHRGQMAWEATWRGVEVAKVQPLDALAQDHFGVSVALDGSLLAIGANGHDGQALDEGAIYLYRAGFAAVSFAEATFKIIESHDRQYVKITVMRDLTVFDDMLVLEYATSDLSATGVDSNKYAECLELPPLKRGLAGCGDYEHTQGLMTIAAGDDRGTFTVGIVDDRCREHFMEFVQLTLSVPGSSSLQGEYMSAKLRIDDNDFEGTSYCLGDQ